MHRSDRAWLVAVSAQFYHWLEFPEGTLARIAIEKMAMVAALMTHSDAVERRRRREFVALYFCAMLPF